MAKHRLIGVQDSERNMSKLQWSGRKIKTVLVTVQIGRVRISTTTEKRSCP